MKKIAIEEHFFTETYVRYLYSRKKWPRREIFSELGERKIKDFWSKSCFRIMNVENERILMDFEDKRIPVMDKTGIEIQVLSLSFPGVEMFEKRVAKSIARDVNEELSYIIKKYHGRFSGFACIPAQDPEAAAEELENAVLKLGLKGAVINGNINGEFLDLEKYWVIFETAERLDVPLYIHPKMPPDPMLRFYLGYPGLAAAMNGFAAEASLHAMRLILSGVFDKYPGLKIILGHLGEAIPFWLWRLDSRWDEEIRTDPFSASFYESRKKRPSQYFLDNFFVTTSGMFWGPVLKFVCQVLSPERVLFATDYPYESAEYAAEFIESVDIDNADKIKICYENARRILKL